MKQIILIVYFALACSALSFANLRLLTSSFTHPDLAKWAAENPVVLENFTKQDFVGLLDESYEYIDVANKLADEKGILSFEFDLYTISESLNSADSILTYTIEKKIRGNTGYNFDKTVVYIMKYYNQNEDKVKISWLNSTIGLTERSYIAEYVDNTYNYWIPSKVKSRVRIRETLIAFLEAMKGEVPVITISKDISGYTLASAGGCYGDDYESCLKWAKIVVPTYHSRITSINDINGIGRDIDFTRDGWYSLGVKDKNNDLYTLFNRAFEPENSTDETLWGKYRAEYPSTSKLPAIDLYKDKNLKNGEVNAMPHPIDVLKFLPPNNNTQVPEKRLRPNVASEVLIHIGSYYKYPNGYKRIAASYGCFGFTCKRQVYATIADAESVIDTRKDINGKDIVPYEINEPCNDELKSAMDYLFGNEIKNKKVLVIIKKRDYNPCVTKDEKIIKSRIRKD